MAEPNEVHQLDEPPAKVQLRVRAAMSIAMLAALFGLWSDVAHWPTSLCGTTPCYWFMRSGALIMVCGIYLAFMAGGVMIKRIQWGDQPPLRRMNPEASRDYARAAFWLVVAGTLIWAFGDWFRG